MAAVTVPNAGKYDLLIDVGFQIDGFVLDDPTKGKLDNTTYVLDGTTSFASVTEGTTNIMVRRGRNDPDDQFTIGTMTFTLNDTLADGVFSPFDQDSPYYNDNANTPGLAPGRRVRLIRYDNANNPEFLFVGRVVNYEYQFNLDGQDTVNVLCGDNMYQLANTALDGHNPTKELTGARINAILDRPEVNYPTGAANRNIATGTVELGGSTQYAIAQGTNVKAYFDQITTTAERGRIFASRSGVLTSQNRIGNTLAGHKIRFSDTSPTDAKYNDLTIDFKADQIINLVDVTTRAGGLGTASNATSQSTYFVKSLYINDSLLHDTAAAGDLATYLLFPTPVARFTGLQTFFGQLTVTQRDTVAKLEIGDTVDIQKQVLVNNVPTTKAQESAIEGIEHRISATNGHSVRIYTSPTTIVYELILDSATQGLLDTNVLG